MMRTKWAYVMACQKYMIWVSISHQGVTLLPPICISIYFDLLDLALTAEENVCNSVIVNTDIIMPNTVVSYQVLLE
jgi:hypothetical protein